MKHQVCVVILTATFISVLCFVLMPRVTSAPGDLDTTFAGTGFTRLGFGRGHDQGYAVARQADGKMVVVGKTSGRFTFVEALRYNTDGSLDTTFGGSGTGQTSIFLGSFGGIGYAVRIQTDGKIVIAGSAYSSVSGSPTDFGVARLKSDGTLDDVFGSLGKVVTPVDSDNDEARAVAIQADGKIVAAGYAGVGARSRFAIVRYLSDGSLDTSFGSGGKVTTSIGAFRLAASAMVIQSGGQILVGGRILNDSLVSDFIVIRYNANGSLDNSFGAGGVVIADFSNSDDLADIAIQSGTPTTPDKIVVAGRSLTSGFNSQYTLVRYNLDGSLDTSFGNGGKVVTPVGENDQVGGLAIQTANTFLRKIVVVGTTIANGDNLFAVVRYNGDGSLDSSFGSGGKALAVAGGINEGNGVALQPDSKIVVAGTEADDFAIMRFNIDGGLDISYDNDGKRRDDGDLFANANAVATQPDGRIVVAGSCDTPAGSDFALARYNPDGTLDTSFNFDGRVTTSFNADNAAFGIAIQTDGKIIAAGTTADATNAHFALARYNINGFLDTSFGTNGKIITSVATNDYVAAVALQSDGKIVVAGTAAAPSGQHFAVVRYHSNGSVDTSFGTSGKVTTPIGSFDSWTGMAFDSNGRIILAGQTNINTGTTSTAVVRYTANGSPDSSFGNGGVVITPFAQSGFANAVAVQTDDRIVVAGQAENGGVALVRHNSNGTLDSSFDGDGAVIYPTASSIEVPRKIAIQSDGKI